jgi:hypothetical protein
MPALGRALKKDYRIGGVRSFWKQLSNGIHEIRALIFGGNLKKFGGDLARTSQASLEEQMLGLF